MLTLYYYPPSAPSRAAVLVSKLLGIDIHILDLKKKQHLKPDFLNINPQHTVPTLVDGDFVLWDSHAIAMYLADTYSKDETFYPKEPKYRARINQRLNFDCGTLYPAIRTICAFGWNLEPYGNVKRWLTKCSLEMPDYYDSNQRGANLFGQMILKNLEPGQV